MAQRTANVIWFRHGLRLHDNPALLSALSDKEHGVALIPVFIFDGESAGKSVGYCLSVSPSPVLLKYELIVRVSVFSVTKYFAVLAYAVFKAVGTEVQGKGSGYSRLGTINSNQTMLSNPICVRATETGTATGRESECQTPRT